MKFDLSLLKKDKAFTLLELSIVLVIVSVLMVGGIGLGITVTKSTNKKDAKSRLDVVERALANFVLENGRLPCPASLSATPVNAIYGKETGAGGTCADASSEVYTNGDLVYGALPFADLGLNPSYGRDPWGHKITYIVDKRLTITKSDTGYDFRSTPAKKYEEPEFSPNGRKNTLLTMKSGDNNAIITEEAVYVLISHGENGQGGYIDETGVQFIKGSTDSYTTEEYPNNAYDGAFNDVFISNKSDGVFDDIIRFKGKTQLLKDAGVKYAACSNTDSLFTDSSTEIFFTGTGDISPWGVAEYGEMIETTNVSGDCIRKFCEAYGMWSPVPTECEDITGGSCFGVATVGASLDSDTGAFEGEEPNNPACFCQNEDVISDGTEIEGAEEAGIVITPLLLRDSEKLKYWINLTENYVAVLGENAENNEVYKINDSSKNCNHLKQTSGINQPLFTITQETPETIELKSLNFDGTDDYMNIDLSDIVNSNYTLFIVEKKEAGASGVLLSSGPGQSDNLEIGYSDSNTFFARWNDGYTQGNKYNYTANELSMSAADTSTTKIWMIQLNEGNIKLTLNKTNTTTGSIYMKGLADGVIALEVNGKIGSGLSNLNSYKGNIFEILGYNYALTDSDIEGVLAYLNSKFTVY